MLTFARTLIGTPYLIGGTTPKAFDCSGFVGYVHREASAIQLPRTSVDQAKVGTKISAAEAQKGDLVFFSHHGTKVDHVAIITSEAGQSLRMIHASTSKGVIESDLAHSEYWMKRITHFQRIR
jgi:lipoprotein Spr